MNTTLIIVGAVLLLLILFIVYIIATDSPYAQKSYWMSNYFESPWKVYGRSNGGMDEAALLALRRANGRSVPSPSDHLLTATIISRNLLNQERHPTDNPEINSEQTRMRLDLFKTARDHYAEAVRGLNTNTVPLEVPARYIIDAATEFAFGGVNELIMNDPMMRFDVFDYVNLVDNQLAAIAANARNNLVNERRAVATAAAVEQGGALAPRVDTYMDLTIQNTNDPQNSHDTGVLACLKAIVTRLREEQGDAPLPTLAEIQQEIIENGERLSEKRQHRVNDVIEVIGRIANGERVVVVDATDEECLRRVWLRTKHPNNSENHAMMVQSIFDALWDCWEDGILERKIVCVNGRTSRILSSLILLDWDKRNWEVKKLEQFKNDIYERTHSLITTEANNAVASGDQEMRKAGKLYLANTSQEVKELGPVSNEAIEKLSQKMRVAVVLMIDSYIRELEEQTGIKGAIPHYMVESTKQEALAAI